MKVTNEFKEQLILTITKASVQKAGTNVADGFNDAQSDSIIKLYGAILKRLEEEEQ